MPIRRDIKITINGKDETGAAIKSANKNLESLAKNLKTLKKLAIAIGSIKYVVAPIVSGMARLVSSSLDTADAIGKIADRTNFAVESFQELAFGADHFDVSQRQLADGLTRLNRRLGLFVKDGGGPAAKAIKSLGIEMRDAAGNVRDTESVFYDVVDAIEAAGSAMEQSAISSQFFGEDAGPRLVSFLNKGRRALEAFAQEAHEAGLVLSEETVRGAEAANDQLAKLKKIISIQFTRAIAGLAPDITRMVDAIASNPEGIKQFGRNLSLIAETIAKIVSFGPELLDMIAGLAAPTDVQRRQRKQLEYYEALADLENKLATGASRRAVNAARRNLSILKAELDELIEKTEPIQVLGDASKKGPLEILITPIWDKSPLPPPATNINEISSTDFFADFDAENQRVAEEVAQEQAEYIAGWEEVADAVRRSIDPVEDHRDALRRLDHLLEQNILTWDEWAEATLDVHEAIDTLAPVAESAINEINEFGLQAARNMQDAFADFLFDPFSEGLDGMLKNFGDVLKRMLAEILAQKLLMAFFSGLSGSGNSFMSGIGDFFGGNRAMGGMVNPGKFYVVGENGPELLVPGSSGHVQPNGGSVPVAVNLVNEGTPQEVSRTGATVTADGVVVDVFLKDLQSGGPMASGLQNAFGLRRGG